MDKMITEKMTINFDVFGLFMKMRGRGCGHT